MKVFSLVLLFAVMVNLSAQSYPTLLHKPLSELTLEQVQRTMLMRLNEMRAELKLKPLQYNDSLELVAFYFMDHKTKWFKEDGKFDRYCHFDDDNNGVIDRYRLFNIQFEIIKNNEKKRTNDIYYSPYKVMAGEIVATTNGSVYQICEAWRKSPRHWVHIIEKDYTHLGIAYRKDHPVVICDFIMFKTQK